MIWLVRHPPVASGGRCYGRLDLLPEPEAVDTLAAELRAKLSACPLPVGPGMTVWTSPSRRCRAVAERLGDHRVDDRLQELDFGDWEGVRWDDVPRASLDAWAADPWRFTPPNGERGADLVARVRNFAAECMVGPCAVITHGGPLKVLIALMLGEEVELLQVAPAAGFIGRFDPAASSPPTSAAPRATLRRQADVLPSPARPPTLYPAPARR